MGLTAESGPLLTFGQLPAGASADTNADAGPNAWYQGDMLLDPRLPFAYLPGQWNLGGPIANGWLSTTNLCLIDQVPVTASATNIANGATATSGTALTLASTSAAGVTVGCSIVNAATGALVTGLIGLDVNVARAAAITMTNATSKFPATSTTTSAVLLGAQVGDPVTLTTTGALPAGFALLTTYYIAGIGYGSGGGTPILAISLSATPGGAPIAAGTGGSGTQSVNLVPVTTPAASTQPKIAFGQGGTGIGGPLAGYNPQWSLSRGLVVTSNGVDTSGTYVIKGFDIYGFPMTQTLTGVSSTTANTTKAFKYIQSVTPQGTINSTALSVGTIDVFGLPLRTDFYQYLNVMWGTPPLLLAYSAGTFVGADFLPATATTGDVRGTIYGGSASDSIRRLMVFWNPVASNMNSTVGLFGQPQF
jgi:hypothetical protein